MKISSEAEMLKLGRNLAAKLPRPAVLELIGDVGVGKTTFTQGLAAGLGVQEVISSPSFIISKRYALPPATTKSMPAGELIHYDFYRLNEPGIMYEELAEAISEGANIIVVEWGQTVSDLLPKDKICLEFHLLEDGSRDVEVKGLV